VFSYKTPRTPEPNEYRVDFPDLDVLRFKFRTVQLNQLAWRDFLDRANPVAAALMSNMAMERGEQPHVKLACLRMLARLQLDPARKRLISGFIDEYLRLTIEQKQEFEAEIKALVPQEREGIMEIVTSWMEDGLEKGMAQGLEMGLEKGERKLLLRQLRKRVDALESASVQQIETLPAERLEELGDALFDFTSHADLVSWLRSHHP
jgi:flagellar biosynthesis/type III secretory pathway protein FliH